MLKTLICIKGGISLRLKSQLYVKTAHTSLQTNVTCLCLKVQKWETVSAEQRCQRGIRLPLSQVYEIPTPQVSSYMLSFNSTLHCACIQGMWGMNMHVRMAFHALLLISTKQLLLLITLWETLKEKKVTGCPQTLKGNKYAQRATKCNLC